MTIIKCYTFIGFLISLKYNNNYTIQYLKY